MNSMYTIANSQEFEIGIPFAPAAKSRNTDKFAAFAFVAPVLVAQVRSRKARRFLLRRCAGIPTRLGCLPVWNPSGSFTTAPSEANMAPITPPRVTSDTVKPKLTQQRLKELLHYDPETGHFTRVFASSNTVKVGDKAGSLDDLGYIRINVGGFRLRAHQLAVLYQTGSLPLLDVDHIDGDRSNNRWDNLREVSRSVNLQNRREENPLNHTSGFLGVSWSKVAKKWWVHLRVDGKGRHVGLFTSVDEARAAYLKAKRELHEGCTI
ncbi:MAG: HNH endonuclease signature motif containing protein [Candidatus Moranbacteria bacterium]|nr:HNH endonuclease signature motif containing protein [Candidatus Moranbacteria bacterium]